MIKVVRRQRWSGLVGTRWAAPGLGPNAGRPPNRLGPSDGAVAASPARVPELALEHLAGTARGQWYVGDVDDLGDLVARDQLPAVREQLVHGDGRTRDRDGVDGLAPPLAGVGKQRVVLAGVEADDVLDEGGKRPGVAVGDQDTAPESARASRGSASTWRVLSGTSTKPAAGMAWWSSRWRWQFSAATATRSLRCRLSCTRAPATAPGGLLPGQGGVAADHRRTPAGRVLDPLQR